MSNLEKTFELFDEFDRTLLSEASKTQASQKITETDRSITGLGSIHSEHAFANDCCDRTSDKTPKTVRAKSEPNHYQ